MQEVLTWLSLEQSWLTERVPFRNIEHEMSLSKPAHTYSAKIPMKLTFRDKDKPRHILRGPFGALVHELLHRCGEDGSQLDSPKHTAPSFPRVKLPVFHLYGHVYIRDG